MQLDLDRVVGYAGDDLTPYGADQLCYPVAAGVATLNTTRGDTAFWSPGDGTRRLSVVRMNPKRTLLVCAERRLSVNLLVFSWPERRLVQRVPDIAKLAVADVAFSRDGTMLAVLADAPTHALSLYTVDPSGRLLLLHTQTDPNDTQYTSVSFSPLGGKDLCTVGGGHVALWRFDKTDRRLTLTECTVGDHRITCHTWGVNGHVLCGTADGAVIDIAPATDEAAPQAQQASPSAPGSSYGLSPTPTLASMPPGSLQAGSTQGDQLSGTVNDLGSIAGSFAGAPASVVPPVGATQVPGMAVRVLDTADGAAVTVLLTGPHHVVVFTDDGKVRFCAHDGRTCEQSLALPVDAVSAAAFDKKWSTLYVGSRRGAILTVALHGYAQPSPQEFNAAQASVRVILDCGPDAVGAQWVSPGVAAVLSSDGLLRISELGRNTLAAKLHVGTEPGCLAVAKNGRCVVGSRTGTVRVVDAQHRGVELRTKVLDDGAPGFALAVVSKSVGHRVLLCTAARTLVIVDTSVPCVEAIVELPDSMQRVLDAQWLPDSDEEFVLSTQHSSLLLCRVPPQSTIDPTTFAAPFDDLYVNIWRTELPMLKVCIPSAYEESFNVFSGALDRDLRFYTVDRALAPDRKDRESKTLKMPVALKEHDKPVGSVVATPKGQLLSGGTDGRIAVRDVAALLPATPQYKDPRKDHAFVARAHVSLDGGVVGLSVDDAGRVLATAADGSVSVWRTTGQPLGVAPFVPARVGFSVQPDEEEVHHFVDKRRLEEEDADQRRHEDYRAEVLRQLQGFRQQMVALREENAKLEDDERLEPEEMLVQRERALFDAAAEEAIEGMRKDVRYTNLRNDFIVAKLKEECWDAMETRLTPVLALATPGLVVHNFHSKARSTEDLSLLRKLKFLRRVDEVDRHRRKVHELEAIVESAGPPDAGDADDDGEEPPLPPLLKIVEDNAPPPEGTEPRKVSLAEDAAEDVEPYLYRPVLAFTAHRAVTQVHLLRALAYNVKHEFNADFVKAVEQKKEDMHKIKERNHRSRQIQKELGEESDLPEYESAPQEDPRRLLVVEDDEVDADKSHDPEEKKRVAAELLERERFLRQHGSDDAPQRALQSWMGGRLEKEIIVLKAEVEIPDFADEDNPKYLPPDDRSEDQTRIFREYEKALAKKVEEVNARRKELQAELNGLQKENDATVKGYDALLQALLLRRIATSQRCCQLDLQQVKLSQSLVLSDDRAAVLRKLEEQRIGLAAKLQAATATTVRFRKELAARRDELQRLQMEERQAERSLRTVEPFPDYGDLADKLHKLYVQARKKKAVKPKKEDKRRRHEEAAAAPTSVDPFAFIERDLEAKKKAQAEEAALAGAFVQRLDRPEAVPEMLWDAFMDYVHKRVQGERAVKELQDEVAAMTAEEEHLVALEEQLKDAVAARAEDLEQFQRTAVREQYDVDELHLFRQGQVEVEQAAVVTDYADAVLIPTKRIQELNTEIRRRGQEKVGLMQDMIQRRRDIRCVEWEMDVITYEMQTLEMQYKHLHTLRVTKQMQEFLNGGGEGHNERERAKLQAKIDHVRATVTSKVEDRKQQMSKMKRGIREREMENNLLLDEVSEAQSLVDTRRSICDLQSTELEHERSEKLMRDMRVTRKLEDVARAQQEELMALKKEVDRLRERTFPSFAVVSKRVIGNPDEV